jgi:23S rRNA pseudouridine1911/1915/1917 synthase
VKQFVVSGDDAGRRLDIFVTDKLAVSRAFIKKLDEQGKIEVNKTKQKAGYKIKSGDKVSVDYDTKAAEIPQIDIPILYEDDDCLVINKPSGLLTHSKGAFNPEPTVATFLFARLNLATRLNLASVGREGIVHRLDRGTSGVMVCAKTPQALAWLQKQFSSRKVKKTYVAVISGTLTQPTAVIDMPIERNPKKPQTFRVGSNGKPAITNYEVIGTSEKYSLVRLQPQTGRTHQLRVHLRKLGHPIIGDTIYGGEPAQRLLLHAQTLEFTLPNHERKVFEANLPSIFGDYVK